MDVILPLKLPIESKKVNADEVLANDPSLMRGNDGNVFTTT